MMPRTEDYGPTRIVNGKLKGPGYFLGQFFNENDPRFNSLQACAATGAAAGMTSMELPLWCGGLIDFDRAVADEDYCAQLQKVATAEGCSISRVTNHLDWQNMCPSPALESHFSVLAPTGLNLEGQAAWSAQRVSGSIRIAKNFGFDVVGGFSGHDPSTHLSYPWAPVNADVIHNARRAHAEAWKPKLDEADEAGVDIAWEIHPMQAVVSGKGFEEYLAYVSNHPRLKQLVDLSHLILQGIPRELLADYIKYWGERRRIAAIHIKEALFDPTFNCGTLDYGPFTEKAARFRGMGDGDIGYVEVVEALDALNIPLNLIMEWEDCGDGEGNTKGKEQALREGAQYIRALLEGTALPEATDPEPHNDGGFEDSLTVDPDDAKIQIARITGIPFHLIELQAA